MPTSIETWQFLSDAIRDLSAICKIAGTGVYKLQDSLNDGGYVIWNGELLQISGGSGSYLRKVEQTSGVDYEGEKHPYYKDVVAERCGNTSGAVPQSGVKNINTISEISVAISTLVDGLNKHVADKENPHKVTKSHVGLGNLPNSKTDSYDTPNGNVLVTATAVANLHKFAKKTYVAKTSGWHDVQIAEDLDWISHSIKYKIEGSFFAISGKIAIPWWLSPGATLFSIPENTAPILNGTILFGIAGDYLIKIEFQDNLFVYKGCVIISNNNKTVFSGLWDGSFVNDLNLVINTVFAI